MNYQEILNSCPSAGSGVHSWMLAVANIGARQGVPSEDVKRDIVEKMPRDPKPANEVEATIKKAYAEAGHQYESAPKMTPAERQIAKERIDEIKARSFVRLAGGEATARDLMEISPCKVYPGKGFEPQMAAMLILRLFDRHEKIWCGKLFETDTGIDTAEAWAERFLCLDEPPPFFIPNPLTGKQGKRKDGDESWRSDECIADWRFALFEVDLPGVSLGHQAAFWIKQIEANQMPVEAITYSGGKSLHALIRVDCRDEMEWDKKVRNGAFPEWIKIGADKACRNPSRLSRLPGHKRDGDKMQSLLWLRGGK